MGKLYVVASRIILFMILPILFIGLTDDAYAARRKKRKSRRRAVSARSYNPKQTKKQALETLRNGSDVLSSLAGLSSEEGEEGVDLTPNFIERQYSDLYETDRNLQDADQEGEDLDELEMEDDVIVDVDNFKMLWMSFMGEGDDENGGMMTCGITKQDLMDNVMDWLGTPYLFGGTSRRAIDCSAFVRQMYLTAGNIMLPRTAREQIGVGLKVARKNLQFGDMIFFHTRKEVYVSHVGIYLGDNLFAHASSRYGVTVSSLESEYYDKRFIGAQRITQKDMVKLSMEEKNF
ncbi:MAG: C40 family peptidase [Candidatus Kapabacteria bacterium]|nr:C40 family peptidase [Candidatus Kapabacteria bacterium]